jgi:predicted amidohydrolase YtcJ
LDVLARHQALAAAKGLRPRIEHVQLLHRDDLPRLAAHGVIASMQPIHATSDYQMADRLWGARSRYAYAFKSVLRVGAVLAFGSDAPVETPDPLQGIYAAVTRQRPGGQPPGGWYADQRLTPEEAVHAYTRGAAYAAGEETVRGTLAPGQYCDLTILSEDIMAGPPAAILAARVLYTVVDGDIVHAAMR